MVFLENKIAFWELLTGIAEYPAEIPQLRIEIPQIQFGIPELPLKILEFRGFFAQLLKKTRILQLVLN